MSFLKIYLTPPASFEEVASILVWGIFNGAEFDSIAIFFTSGLLLKILWIKVKRVKRALFQICANLFAKTLFTRGGSIRVNRENG